MKHRVRQFRKSPLSLLAAVFVTLVIITSCGSPANRLPFETLAIAENWRLLYHYDFLGSKADRLRISPEQRATVISLREALRQRVKLAYWDSPEADITVTIEERQRASGFGQMQALQRREYSWWIRFYDSKGKLLAEYRESRQSLIRQSDSQALINALREQITRALRGDKIRL